MEYGLWPIGKIIYGNEYSVLILVLMEYGLWRFSPVLNICAILS